MLRGSEPDVYPTVRNFRCRAFPKAGGGTKVTLVKPAVHPSSNASTHYPMRELKRDTSPLSMVYLPWEKRIREKSPGWGLNLTI